MVSVKIPVREVRFWSIALPFIVEIYIPFAKQLLACYWALEKMDHSAMRNK